jgi:hypothetical protein
MKNNFKADLSKLLPLAIDASIKIIQTDQKEETVTAVFDFFQSVIEYDVPVISPYVKSLTEMTLTVKICLNILRNLTNLIFFVYL